MKVRGIKYMVGASVIAALSLGVAGPASALGANSWDCGSPAVGTIGGVSVSGSGSTSDFYGGCSLLGLRLQYRAYPGAPLTWTPFSYNSGQVSITQGGTVGGDHFSSRDSVHHYT